MSRLEIPTTHSIHATHNTIKQSSEMLLYDTFKLYFDIDLENDIQHINESKEALDTFLKDCKNDYIQILQNDITQENLKTLQASKEYLALLHIQYCGDSKQVFGKGFKEALKEQSRLKLWYEIRYNSGSTKNKDIALRRFKQSNLFGLYDNNDINNIILQPLYDSTPLTNNLNQYKVSLNEAITFFTFLNIAKHPQSHTYYTSIISLEAAIKKYFTNNDFPQSQSLDSITQAFLHTMKQYYIQEHNPSLSIGSIYIIQKSKNKPNVIDNIATINKRMWQNNASTFFVFYPEHISDIALQIRQKPNSMLYLIVCKDTKIDCAYLESNSRLYMSDFKDSQSTNYYLGTEINHNTQSTQESTSQENTYLELEPNGNDIADTQQEYIFKNAEPILTINKHQSNILLYNIGFAKQGNSISNEISKDTKVNKLGIALRLKDNKAHSTDCSKEGNFTLHINELYIYCSTQHSSIPNTHTTQNQSQDSIDSMHDSHNTQGQPIIYLLNCENRKTYPIALQANTDTNGNIIQDKADNTSYNAILSTELNLDMKATTKLILSCNDLVAQHYSTYDIHKITGVGIVSVNYDLKQKAKKGESIIYKNVLQLKQTTTLDEMITNTDSILEVKIHNTQKPLKIDTTLECEALYYGYKLIQWAYMILPTKEYNPNKTKLQKDIDYYELPSDTYKGNIISFNPKEYLQSKENTRDTQTHQSSTTHISQANNTQESITTPNSQNANNNISNTTQTNTNTQITQQTHQSTQLAKLLSGEYTLILFAYQKTPAYKVKNYATHTKLDYNPPLSLRFNGKELQIVEWGEIKRDKLDSNIFDNRNENTAYYRIYSKEYDVIDAQDIPKLFSSYSLTLGIIDTERYYKSNHLKEQDILESMKQDTSLPKGSYYLDIKDIEESLKIRTDYLYTRASGYKALNIYTIDTPNNQYKISYFNNPLDNIPYPKGTTFLTTPNTPIPTYHTDERVKIFLKGSKTYKDFILNLKQKIDSIQSQYEIERIRLEVGYENTPNYYVDSEGYIQGADFRLPTDGKGNGIKTNLASFIEHGQIGKIGAIILHRTVSKSAQSSINWWQNHGAKGTGTHFLIDKDGTIYQCASLHKTTWHVGKRKKGITITNKTSIGIEVVAWYDNKTQKWDEATQEQKVALRKTIKILLNHYNLTENDIYEHDKIADKTAGEGANLYTKGVQ